MPLLKGGIFVYYHIDVQQIKTGIGFQPKAPLKVCI